RGSRALHPVHREVDAVERGRGGNVEIVPLRSAEGDVADDLGHLDLAEQVALRRVAVHAVAGAGPDIAVGIEPEAVGEPRADVGEQPAARQLLAADDVEGPDMVWPVRRVRAAG